MRNTDKNGCHNILVLNTYETQEEEKMNTRINYTVRQKELRVKAKIAISDQVLDLTIDTGAQISTLRPCKLFGEIMVNCDKKIPIIGIAKDLTTQV